MSEQVMPYRSGRHFLQIPGRPTWPDRVLRAIDRATMDIAARFGPHGAEILEGLKAVFQTRAPVVIYPASGTGAWEAALVNTLSPGDRVLSSKPGISLRCGTRWRTKLGLSVDLVPTDCAAASIRLRSRPGSRKIPSSGSGPCACAQRDFDGVASRIGAIRKAIDAAMTPRALHGRHDFRRLPRSTTATTSGASTSPSPARRKA